ncbi:MAG: hypothetical protein R3D55_17215 [Chloroflexota bacterium]
MPQNQVGVGQCATPFLYPLPSARDTTDAPPAPTVVDTPPRAITSTEIIDVPAAASALMPTDKSRCR